MIGLTAPSLVDTIWRAGFGVARIDGMTDFEAVWQRIVTCVGQQFLTKTGIPFTYTIEGTSVVPDRTRYPLHVSQFQLAFDRMPLRGPGEINRLVRGPAYIFAILTDPRIS
jgi:hypothetical protein